nr:glycosyltransferase [Oceanisphaera pacifica]
MGVNKVDSYLLTSINSILQQTLKNFEFIIIVNGVNSDAVALYINEHVSDSRIVILKSDIAQLAYALNLGIDHAKYKYIARMDADDISEPDRLEKQLKFLIDNELDLVGTDSTLIDKNGKVLGKRITEKGNNINNKISYKNCFVHPSTMYKKETILKLRGYNSGFNSEDYDLWLRMKRSDIRWGNMNACLFRYRVHEDASQGRILGYAEVAGYSVREFILHKNISNLLAAGLSVIKSFFRGR